MRDRVVISGDPGAGKTTLMRKRSKPGTVCWDMDEVAAELGYKPDFPRPENERADLMLRRSELLQRLRQDRDCDCAIIVTNFFSARRIAEFIGAEHVHFKRRDPPS